MGSVRKVRVTSEISLGRGGEVMGRGGASQSPRTLRPLSSREELVFSEGLGG